MFYWSVLEIIPDVPLPDALESVLNAAKELVMAHRNILAIHASGGIIP